MARPRKNEAPRRELLHIEQSFHRRHIIDAVLWSWEGRRYWQASCSLLAGPAILSAEHGGREAALAEVRAALDERLGPYPNEREQRLLAQEAAPDLLSAAKRVLAWHDRQGGHGAIPADAERELREAIAKAEGR